MSNPERGIIDLLIVEDDEDDYVLTATLLDQTESFEFNVEWVPDPQHARQIFSENRHDICLMDYRLGAEVSIDLVREALSLGFTAPIIMLTGQDDTGVEMEAAAAGAVDYLIKDHLGREQLLRSIRYALARSEIQAERFERVRAETANRSKSEFLAVLSHEIRTPLTAIIGYTELLIHRHQHNDADLAHKLQIINRNGSHLLSLLNDTLDLSKIESGKLEVAIEKMALGPFVMDSVALMRAMAEAKQLTLQTTARTALPRYIYSDPMRLRQILLNLLGNAIKYTDSGTVELQLKMDGPCLEFHVVDTGKGMSRSDLKRIFLPFTQLSQGRRQGTGLGLTISLKLAQKLGGTISAHSIEGAGSRFIARIDPGAIDMDETTELLAPTDDIDQPIRPAQAVGGYILVVDDVEDVRDLIGSILTEAGMQVLTASDGQEALDILANPPAEPIVLLLMDINMPVLDGRQTLTRMRELGHGMPVIALTAANLTAEREMCLSAGFAAYLAKPVTSALLLAEIQKQATAAALEPEFSETEVLVVEDNEDANAGICLLLQLLGYASRGAHSAPEAVKLFAQRKPGVVLADLDLGNGDGLTVLRQLFELAPKVRYFVLSGNLTMDRAALPSFVEAFIAKPVTLDALTSALDTGRAAP